MNRRRRLMILPIGLLAATAFALGACGDDESSSTADFEPAGETTTSAEQPVGGSGEIAISADPSGSLAFEQASVEAGAGKLGLTFTNDSEVVHDVVIEQDGSDVAATERVTGASTSEQIKLEAGEYRFYCSITGHRLAGMEGALTVK